MAWFIGTFPEFYQWTKARTKAWITQETRPKKRKAGKCALCGEEKPLTSAHIVQHRNVVRAALGVTDDKAQHAWDTSDAWEKIKNAHRPFDKVFQYLCEPCHAIVDKKDAQSLP